MKKLIKELETIRLKNKVGEFEIECMKKAVSKKQIESTTSK
jgi:hypothetical protein